MLPGLGCWPRPRFMPGNIPKTHEVERERKKKYCLLTLGGSTTSPLFDGAERIFVIQAYKVMNDAGGFFLPLRKRNRTHSRLGPYEHMMNMDKKL